MKDPIYPNITYIGPMETRQKNLKRMRDLFTENDAINVGLKNRALSKSYPDGAFIRVQTIDIVGRMDCALIRDLGNVEVLPWQAYQLVPIMELVISAPDFEENPSGDRSYLIWSSIGIEGTYLIKSDFVRYTEGDGKDPERIADTFLPDNKTRIYYRDFEMIYPEWESGLPA